MNSIDQVVRAALIAAGADEANINSTATIRSLGIHSLDAFVMIMDLEERFDIRLSNRELDVAVDSLATMGKAIQRAIERRSKPASGPLIVKLKIAW